MTKSEALEFLELPEETTDTEIKKTLENLLASYESLSEKAPSDFLRKLNAQKVVKIKGIQKDLLTWAREKQKPNSIILTEDDSEEESEEEEELPATAPIIIAHGSRSSKNTPVVEPAGWLIRHTEDQSSKTYSLWKGKNYIGRKLHDSLKPFIVIDEDLYISRVHAVIIAEGEADNYNFYIEDSAASNDSAASTNGSFLNGKEKRITSKTKLNENDTIQIGVTKLILRYNNHPIKKLVKEVEKSKFMHTVALEL